MGRRPRSWLPVARHEGMRGQEGTRQLLPELVAWHRGSGAEGGQVPKPAAPQLTPHADILPEATHPPRNGVHRHLCVGECSPDLPSACQGLRTHRVGLGRGGMALAGVGELRYRRPLQAAQWGHPLCPCVHRRSPGRGNRQWDCSACTSACPCPAAVRLGAGPAPSRPAGAAV